MNSVTNSKISNQEDMTNSCELTHSKAWKALAAHFDDIKHVHMRQLFEENSDRFTEFSLQFKNLLLDYSKNRINKTTMTLLYDLAEQAGVKEWTERMFNGEAINHTENRSVLHTALRNRDNKPVYAAGEDVMPRVNASLEKMRAFSEAIRTRKWRGYTNQPIKHVVNIGVGGSDLGPVMVTEALKPYALHDIQMHYVSNVDESHIWDTLARLKPETTLFIVVSKSFTTQDTMLNAATAIKWLKKSIEDPADIEKHVVAATDNIDAAVKLGIGVDNIFSMWDWVGGRYSLWSAVGLSIAISIGMDNFEKLLEGAFEMDTHFRTAPLEENLPVTLAMLGIWYNNFFGSETHAVLPYDQHLHLFSDYLRQADMESNGKRVDRDGNIINNYSTGPIIFGQLGITGQHAFYQLIHQGTKLIPADIIAPISSYHCIREHHRVLMSNVFAQTEAFMRGKTEQEAIDEMRQNGASPEEIAKLLPHKIFPGNKPSNTIIYKVLSPRTLGNLIALYEHKIFVQGVVWNINSFDQWGVELGKQLAKGVLSDLQDDNQITSHDSSTNGLINYYKSLRHTDNE
ncbi:Glucose-6-phosphate isomerase [hydrothermal vent metagenome]|uniref:glucose-6-phosphate isomerase n=1 Tax=hydrothermal vent metagenome TaxID=652676 RepID=A0A3B1AJJ8_9ZZZZ